MTAGKGISQRCSLLSLWRTLPHPPPFPYTSRFGYLAAVPQRGTRTEYRYGSHRTPARVTHVQEEITAVAVRLLVLKEPMKKQHKTIKSSESPLQLR